MKLSPGEALALTIFHEDNQPKTLAEINGHFEKRGFRKKRALP